MTMGKGGIISSSNKQKLNTKSTCESEFVGNDDVISTMLQSLYFIKAQGILTNRICLYQDNKSTILLANHGQMSSSKRTKHLKAKCFFIADRVNDGEVTIEHLPIEEMCIDVNTKPNEGKRFRMDRAKLMNCAIDIQDETLSNNTMTTNSNYQSATGKTIVVCRSVLGIS